MLSILKFSLKQAILTSVVIATVSYSSVSALTSLSIYSLAPGSGPGAIVSKSDGLVWFTETNGRNLGNINQEGVIAKFISPSNSQPTDIIEGPDGAIWFTNTQGRIGRAETGADAVLLSNALTDGARYLTVGSDGAIWFTEYWNGTSGIGRLNMSGEVIHYPVAGDRSLLDITAGPDGALWFIAYSNNTDAVIVKMSTEGQYQMFSVPTYAAYPFAITAGPDGALWFTETNSGKIGRIEVNGNITEYKIPYNINPSSGITAGPDGALWFNSGSDYAIYRMTTSGATERFEVPSTTGAITAITSDHKNSIWFTSAGTASMDTYIGRFTLDMKPSKPDNLKVIKSPTYSPSLLWNDVNNAASYNIYRNGVSVGTSTTNVFSDDNAPEGEATYYVTAVNAGGESLPSNTVNVSVDRTNPTITHATSSVANTDGWNKGNVIVSFDCNDNLSGVQTCSQPVTVTNVGTSQIVTGTAVDKAGNTSTTSVTVNIDKKAPTLAVPSWTSSSIQQGKTTALSVVAADGLSGLKTVKYAINGGMQQSMNFDTSSNTWRATLGSDLVAGSHTVTITATDRADNTTQRNSTLTVTKPTNPSPLQTIVSTITAVVKTVVKALLKLFSLF